MELQDPKKDQTFFKNCENPAECQPKGTVTEI